MTAPDAILIAGPTASGKSALALTLAERIGGDIINADAMQVYRDLRIITARPSPEEEARAPHRLYGHVDAAVNYSVGHYLRDAGAAIAAARHRQRVPILVGGTGLYFKALTHGLAAVPPIRTLSATACGRHSPCKAPKRCMRSSRAAIPKPLSDSVRATAPVSPARSK